MGFGSYKASDWSKLKQSKKMDQTQSETEIFTRRSMNPKFDPRYIDKREARDSEDHPNSTPIILGLDVTGSMGYLSNQIARESLHETMMKLYSTNAIEDPAILFAAYGDYIDEGVLQVTQFESDIRIAEQLLELWLENGGCGQVTPSYLWHFAAAHTSLDAYEKHQKKGYLITIGDNADFRDDEAAKTCFGKLFPDETYLRGEDLIKEVSKKFEVMHIAIGSGEDQMESFTRLIPGHVMSITVDDIQFLPEIIISAMQIVGGRAPQDTIAQWTELAQPVVRKAVSRLSTGNSKVGYSF